MISFFLQWFSIGVCVGGGTSFLFLSIKNSRTSWTNNIYYSVIGVIYGWDSERCGSSTVYP